MTSLHLTTNGPDDSLMRHYFTSYDGNSFELPARPRSRAKAIELIRRLSPGAPTAGTFQFRSIDSLDVSAEESYDIEAFTLTMRRYEGGHWGLAEVSSIGNMSLPAGLRPTSTDVLYYLQEVTAKLTVKAQDVRSILEKVDDFHVLQFLDGTQLLASITWNFPDSTESYYRLPRAGDELQALWGDAFITDITLVRQALAQLRITPSCSRSGQEF